MTDGAPAVEYLLSRDGWVLHRNECTHTGRGVTPWPHGVGMSAEQVADAVRAREWLSTCLVCTPAGIDAPDRHRLVLKSDANGPVASCTCGVTHGPIRDLRTSSEERHWGMFDGELDEDRLQAEMVEWRREGCDAEWIARNQRRLWLSARRRGADAVAKRLHRDHLASVRAGLISAPSEG